MIVDSHAHYAHASFSNAFRYLSWEDTWVLKEGTLEDLLDAMDRRGVRLSVEPGISLNFNEKILALAERYPGRIFPAMGCHPTRCIHEKWSDRKRLDDYCARPGVVAVGETGLDYHHPRLEQQRRKQFLWFFYQLRLARKHRLPLVLHIRDADRDAIRVLKFYKPKYGGVVHCCGEGWDVISEYLKLGLYIGVGGTLLNPARNEKLKAAIPKIPLERIVIETDSPYVLPYCKDVLPPKLVRRARNSSLILPRVIEEIAALQDRTPEAVEQATAENAIRLYKLPELQQL